MAQALQIEPLRPSKNQENRSKIRAVTTPRSVEENAFELIPEKTVKPAGPIAVGNKVRHTRFLNTNGPSGTYVLEISDSKALCQYVDTFGKTKQVWFVLKDLIQAD